MYIKRKTKNSFFCCSEASAFVVAEAFAHGDGNTTIIYD
jgi:hypothetical protein